MYYKVDKVIVLIQRDLQNLSNNRITLQRYLHIIAVLLSYGI